MASHKFAIAKASFSAGLLRPDPTSLSREDIARFHSVLNAAVAQCSPTNVQNCKRWILENIVQSSARFAALGKYLTALATSYGSEPSPTTISVPAKREPSIKRKRLHILYILNDILYHAKYRINDASICSKVQPMLMSLFANAASFKECPKQQQKVLDLLSIWEENGYYSAEYMNKLRETVRNASESGVAAVGDGLSGGGEQDPATKSTKIAPFVMPAMHGDASTPWFDLPAGNLMPHIVPNSTRPINPDMIKPLQFVAGPADEVLALAVKTLLDDVQKIFGVETEEEDGLILGDIDELGQPIIIDEITGDVLEGEGYYGWSRTFCEKMKRRRSGYKNPTETDNGGRRSRSRSRSSSPDRHRGKRRRYSDSDNGSSRSSLSRRRRSFSSSRSPSPENGRRTRGNRESHSRSRSPSNIGRSPPPSSREPSHSTPTVRSQSSMEGLPLKPPQSSYTNPPMMFPQSIPPHFNPNFPPPPPPPNMAFSGPGAPWIPPPPPLHNNVQFNTWPPPPPPPPPNYAMPPGPSGGWQTPAPNQGRGGYNNKNNGWHGANQGGRGGRGDYRGRGWS